MHLLLEIQKLNNEDVIATSSKCSFEDYENKGWMEYSGSDYFNEYIYNDIQKVYDNNGNLLGDKEKLEIGQHYHIDDNANAYLCEDDSHEKYACFAIGTKITMADGSIKNIEDINLNDLVLTFNHETGVYESRMVFIAYHGENKATSFKLRFDNGNTISIVGEHALFEKESLKYVGITESNAEQFIGKHFYSVLDNKYVELISVTHENEPVDFYSIYTKYNQNCIANGMLSLSNDAAWTLNYYEFNENLKADLDVLASDFKKYGVFESEENEMYKGFSSERSKYLNIVVGKGLLTWEEWEEIYKSTLANIEW